MSVSRPPFQFPRTNSNAWRYQVTSVSMANFSIFGAYKFIFIIKTYKQPWTYCCSVQTTQQSSNNNNDNNNNAASYKEEKHTSTGSKYLFAPIAVETLGPMNTSACQLYQSGKKDLSAPGDDREGAFPFQRVSALVQRYNAVLLHDTLPAPDCTNSVLS